LKEDEKRVLKELKEEGWDFDSHTPCLDRRELKTLFLRRSQSNIGFDDKYNI